MAGHWEIWELEHRNMVSDAETEVEALQIVRTFVTQGWTYAELLLMFDDPALADEDLPPGVTGEELARRAEAAASNPVRRTA
jgi:hypothetical protein